MRFRVLLASMLVMLFCVQGLLPQPVAGSSSSPLMASATVAVDGSSSNLVVSVADDVSFDAVSEAVAASGRALVFSSRSAGIMTVAAGEGARELADAIAQVPGVLSVSSERKARTTFTPDDSYIGYQWALDAINAYDAWDIGRGAEDVVVAVLDTGIDWNHADLAANMWSNEDGYHGYNFIDENWFPMDDNVNGYDEDGTWIPNLYTYHGTHVAGIVGAVTNNDEGIAGLAQIRLMAVKVMNDSGEGTDATVAAGMRYAVENDADIIVMSLGVDGVSLTLQSNVNYASEEGVVMVAAAGNSGTSEVSYPAAFGQVIGVGASDDTDRRASFSNYGIGLDILAPGVNIYSTQGGGSYQYLSGTSAAAPHVAGVAALMLSINPILTTAQVGAYINQTAQDVSMTGYDTSTGWGIVDAFSAVESIASPTITLTDYPDSVPPNGTFSISWLVSGGDPGVIEETYLVWGPSPSELTSSSVPYNGTTWAEFSVDGIPALSTNGTMYLRAVARVDGVLYESVLLSIAIQEDVSDNFFMQFLRDVQDFIFNELGLTTFLLILAILIAIPLVIFAARPRRHKALAPIPAPAYVQSAPLEQYRPVQGVPHMPPPPPPPPRFEAYVDVVGQAVVPRVVKVYEGTKVVWVNRAWAPPPGIAIKSGRLDSSGEHPDGLFQSGNLIAPGDYWSVTFHKSGDYEYYLTTIWQHGKIIVEPYKHNNHPASRPVA